METTDGRRSPATEQPVAATGSTTGATGAAALPVIPVSDVHDRAAAPAISALIPGQGATSGGNSVIINGTALSFITAVRFDTTPAAFTVISDTQATAIAPPHTAGTVQVTVTAPGGTRAVGAYTYAAAPVI